MKRTIQLALSVQYGNGDTVVHTVMPLPIPANISKSRKPSDDRDELLTEHVDYLQYWLKKAIDNQVYQDGLPEAGMGSGCW